LAFPKKSPFLCHNAAQGLAQGLSMSPAVAELEQVASGHGPIAVQCASLLLAGNKKKTRQEKKRKGK
jgi:hypothetical protein